MVSVFLLKGSILTRAGNRAGLTRIKKEGWPGFDLDIF